MERIGRIRGLPSTAVWIRYAPDSNGRRAHATPASGVKTRAALEIDFQPNVSRESAHVDIVVLAFRFQFAEAIHHFAKQLET